MTDDGVGAGCDGKVHLQRSDEHRGQHAHGNDLAEDRSTAAPKK
ncbi:hypothetical protein [Methylocystis rosea]|nr:hypothetical protein [Methylocystis rosea]